MKNTRKFKVGDWVTYIPNHADPNDTSFHERGIVTSVKDNEDGTQKVWVRYKGLGGELTPTENLTHG